VRKRERWEWGEGEEKMGKAGEGHNSKERRRKKRKEKGESTSIEFCEFVGTSVYGNVDILVGVGFLWKDMSRCFWFNAQPRIYKSSSWAFWSDGGC
jgi:hypothetical protein